MVARFIGGLGIGGSSVLGPGLHRRTRPRKWRGRMVGLFQINIVVGILLAYLSNYIITTAQPRPDSSGAGSSASRSSPSILFLFMLYGIPRSSRWLVTTNQTDEARQVLEMMGSPNSEAELQEIIDSIHQERGAARAPLQRQVQPARSARHHDRPVQPALRHQRHPLLLNYIFASAGFSQTQPPANRRRRLVNLLATFLGMSLIDKLGRKTLLLIGAIGMTAVASAESPPSSTPMPIRPSGLAAGPVHRLLRDLAGFGHLGLHLAKSSPRASAPKARASAPPRTGS
jgi:SP family arabinose:H+ symporter-like MFS transporter